MAIITQVTGQQIIDAVRGLLQDDEADQSTILQMANWAQDELCTGRRLSFLQSSDDLTPAAGDVEVELPDGIDAVISRFVTVPRVYSLDKYFIQYEDFIKSYPNYETINPGQISYWTIFGTRMRFNRPLDVDHNIRIEYYRIPKHVINAAGKFDITSRHMELFAKMAFIRMKENDEEYDEAQRERNLLTSPRPSGLSILQTFYQVEGPLGTKTGPTVMRTNRRRRGGETGGVPVGYSGSY